MPGQQCDLSLGSAPRQGPEGKTRGLGGAGRITRESCDAKPRRNKLFRDAEVGKSLQHAGWRPRARLHFVDHTVVREALWHTNPVLARKVRRVDGFGASQPVVEGRAISKGSVNKGNTVRSACCQAGVTWFEWAMTTSKSVVRPTNSSSWMILSWHTTWSSGLFSSESSSGGRMRRAADGKLSSVTVPVGRCLNSSQTAWDSAIATATRSALSANARPASVRRSPRPTRSVRGIPDSRSSSLSC